MAHFAQILNGVVQRVIVVANADAPDPAPEQSEETGKVFIRDVLKLDGEWVQTSYNGTFRKNYAGVGYLWDAVNDVFYPPSPYPSWVLDENFTWQPPIPYPDDGGVYEWDEDTVSWVSVEEGGDE